MLQLLALLFCALVAFLCVLSLCIARDWFGGLWRAFLARASACLLLAFSMLCGWMSWYSWGSKELTARNAFTMSEAETDAQMHLAAVRAGFSNEDADVMVKSLKKFLIEHPDALTR